MSRYLGNVKKLKESESVERIPPEQARRDRGPGALGTTRRPLHQGVRRPSGVAGHPHLPGHVSTMMGIIWWSVSGIVVRVVAVAEVGRAPLAHSKRIGFHEISHLKAQRYIIVAVDHDTGHLIWGAARRDQATLNRLFDTLGPERCRKLRRVSRDGAFWIADVVTEPCSEAIHCTHPFHVVQWVTDALDEVRRDVWNQARRAGQAEVTHALKGARWALWHNLEHLTDCQQSCWLPSPRPTGPSIGPIYSRSN